MSLVRGADAATPTRRPTRRPTRPRAPGGAGLGRFVLRETLRDRALVAQAVLAPLAVLLLTLVAGQFLVPEHPRTVVVAGDVATVSALTGTLTAGGDTVSVAAGALGAPGPGLDATVIVVPTGSPDTAAAASAGLHVTVRVTQVAAFTAGDLRRDVSAAVPGAVVEVLGPDGEDVHGSAGQLLPGAVVVTCLVLALPGTAGRVVGWRRRGVLDVALPALAGRWGVRGAGLRAALLLVPSRWLLTLPSVVVAVAGCAAAGVLHVGPDSTVGIGPAVVFATLVLLGSSVCTTLGVLLGCVLRSRREARAVLWPAVVVVAVFGLVLLPASVLPDGAAAVLRWTPTALLAEGLRNALTGAAGTSPVVSLGVLTVVLVAATAALVRWFCAAMRPRR